MNNNETILQTILSSVSSQTLSALVVSTGESEKALKTALTQTIPVVLGALIGQTEIPSSTASPTSQENIPTLGLSKLLVSVSELSSAYGIPAGRTGTSLDALVEDPSHLFLEMSATGTPAQTVVPRMITQLFGTQAEQTVRILGNLSGVKPSSMTALIALALPLVFSRLAGPISQAGLPFNVSSLSTLLITIAPQISKALPSGLASMLSLGGVLSSFAPSNTATSTDFTAGKSARQAIPAPHLVTKKSSVPYAPLFTGLALIGGALYLWKSMSPQAVIQQASVTVPQAVAPVDPSTSRDLQQPTIEVAPSSPHTSEDEPSRAMLGNVAEVGAALDISTETPILTTLTLPNGTSVAGVAGKIESQLIAAISNASPPLDDTAWFDFDRLTFDVGSSELSANSQEQIQNIATILTAYPTARVKIGGFTDSSGDISGDSASNMALSERRAQAVKSAVVQRGIPESRVEAEGYGSSLSLTSNDTAERRSLNRRIALRLLAK